MFVAKLEIGRVVSSLALHIDRHFVTTLYEIRDLKPDITKQISIYVVLQPLYSLYTSKIKISYVRMKDSSNSHMYVSFEILSLKICG